MRAPHFGDRLDQILAVRKQIRDAGFRFRKGEEDVRARRREREEVGQPNAWVIAPLRHMSVTDISRRESSRPENVTRVSVLGDDAMRAKNSRLS